MLHSISDHRAEILLKDFQSHSELEMSGLGISDSREQT